MTDAKTTSKTASNQQEKPTPATEKPHRSLVRRILSLLNDVTMTTASVIAVGALCISAVSVYISPAFFPAVSLLGLAFPLTVAATVAVWIVTMIMCFRRSWICLVGLILTCGSLRAYFPLNPFQAAHLPSSEAFRVIGYNAHMAGQANDSTERHDFLQYVLDQQADVFCLQEGSTSIAEWDTINPRFRQHYPYSVERNTMSTQGCFSRYPIKRSEVVTHVGSGNAAIAYWIDHPQKHDILVLNCHLQSNQLTIDERSQYSDIVHRQNQEDKTRDDTYNTSRLLASKYIKAAEIRALMADTVVTYLAKHPDVPTIVCGDFNDTPISYCCYRMTRHGLTDAFRTAGNGMGRSFNKDAIAVRIDHQYCSSHLRPINARIDNLAQWSDHYPSVVTYEWTQ